MISDNNTSLAVKGALAHRTACNAAPLAQSKIADWVLKLVKPLVIGHPEQLSQNKFLIRSFLQWEPQKSKMATRGPKMADGVYAQCLLSNVFRQEMFKTVSYSSTLRSLRRSHQLSLNKLFDPSAPSMRKVDDRKRKRKEIIMSFLVATNVIASRPPERRPTGTPHARANGFKKKGPIWRFLRHSNILYCAGKYSCAVQLCRRDRIVTAR